MFKVRKRYLGRDVAFIKRESNLGIRTLSKMMGVSESALREWTSKSRSDYRIKDKYSTMITEIVVALNDKKSAWEQGRPSLDADEILGVPRPPLDAPLTTHEKISNAAKKAWITRKKNLAKHPKQLKANGHIVNEAADTIASSIDTAKLLPLIAQIKATQKFGPNPHEGYIQAVLKTAEEDVERDKKKLEIEKMKNFSDDMLSLVFRRIVFTDDKIDLLCKAMVANFREGCHV